MGAEYTVIIKGTGMRYEALAAAAVDPGKLLELDSAGKVKHHATAGGRAERAFAVEDDVQGNDKSDQYASGALVQYEIVGPGTIVNARIYNGENIAIGDKLVSQGDGTLKEHDAYSSATTVEEDVIAVAVEACDMSGSSGEDPTGWCKVRII